VLVLKWPYCKGAFVSIPQTWLEGFYYIQMYKLGSATRPGGNVIDLMGPWWARSTMLARLLMTFRAT